MTVSPKPAEGLETIMAPVPAARKVIKRVSTTASMNASYDVGKKGHFHKKKYNNVFAAHKDNETTPTWDIEKRYGESPFNGTSSAMGGGQFLTIALMDLGYLSRVGENPDLSRPGKDEDSKHYWRDQSLKAAI